MWIPEDTKVPEEGTNETRCGSPQRELISEEVIIKIGVPSEAGVEGILAYDNGHLQLHHGIKDQIVTAACLASVDAAPLCLILGTSVAVVVAKCMIKVRIVDDILPVGWVCCPPGCQVLRTLIPRRLHKIKQEDKAICR